MISKEIGEAEKLPFRSVPLVRKEESKVTPIGGVFFGENFRVKKNR